jgi:hypothetical protein
MLALIEPVSPVNRVRLARYLELPSLDALDPVTDAEIAKLDARRDELIAQSSHAVELRIERTDRQWITTDHGTFEATEAYGCHLRDSGADALIVAALTIGPRVDEIIKQHVAQQDVYEAFVLKQWAATMTEQARVDLTRQLSDRSDGRSLLPYDGPGYNGWPLSSLHALLDIVYRDEANRPIRATESGVLLPTNSMVIVFGVTSQRIEHNVNNRLAQCTRCAMRNCNYRMAGA